MVKQQNILLVLATSSALSRRNGVDGMIASSAADSAYKMLPCANFIQITFELRDSATVSVTQSSTSIL